MLINGINKLVYFVFEDIKQMLRRNKQDIII